MKKLIIGIALAAVGASPAFADSYRSHAYRGDSANEAYAAAPGFANSGSQLLIENGKVIGADPDANVRLMMRKGQPAEANE